MADRFQDQMPLVPDETDAGTETPDVPKAAPTPSQVLRKEKPKRSPWVIVAVVVGAGLVGVLSFVAGVVVWWLVAGR